MKILVVDGQGGGMGKALVQALKREVPGHTVLALGTNAMATAAMLKAGADAGATGENAIAYNCGDADLILGPYGIVLANAMLGEISPRIARAVSESPAERILLPVSRCHTTLVGLEHRSVAQLVEEAARLAAERCNR